jgi:DNA primase
MELTRLASGRLEVHESLLEKELISGGSRGGGRSRQGRLAGTEGRPASDDQPSAPSTIGRGNMSRREDTERAFLALCIASPEEGGRALASLDVEEHFASELLRCAARRLREGDLRAPMAESADEGNRLEADPELKGLLAELVVEAGREESHPAMLEAQRLQLELARVDRQIQRARGQESGDVSELAQHRTEVKREFDRAYGRVLEETGDREG